MIIKLDTIAKTIQIDGNANAFELFESLQAMLPNDLWKEFTIFQKPTEYIYNPVYPVSPYTSPFIWRYNDPIVTLPWIDYSSSNFSISIDAANTTSGDFNVIKNYRKTLNDGVYDVVIISKEDDK